MTAVRAATPAVAKLLAGAYASNEHARVDTGQRGVRSQIGRGGNGHRQTTKSPMAQCLAGRHCRQRYDEKAARTRLFCGGIRRARGNIRMILR